MFFQRSVLIILIAIPFVVDCCKLITILSDFTKENDIKFFKQTLPWIVDNIGSKLRINYHFKDSGKNSGPRKCVLSQLTTNSYLQASYLSCEASGKPLSECIKPLPINTRLLNTCLRLRVNAFVKEADIVFRWYKINTSPVVILPRKRRISNESPEKILEAICTLYPRRNKPTGCVRPKPLPTEKPNEEKSSTEQNKPTTENPIVEENEKSNPKPITENPVEKKDEKPIPEPSTENPTVEKNEKSNPKPIPENPVEKKNEKPIPEPSTENPTVEKNEKSNPKPIPENPVEKENEKPIPEPSTENPIIEKNEKPIPNQTKPSQEKIDEEENISSITSQSSDQKVTTEKNNPSNENSTLDPKEETETDNSKNSNKNADKDNS